MKRREKKNLYKVIFGAIVLFVGMLGLTVFYTPALTANATWIDVYDWFAGIATDIGSNLGLILGGIGALVLGYYFLVYRPKTRH